MSDNRKKPAPGDDLHRKVSSPELENEHVSTSVALDDEQRIRVLSPGMLVFKRFVRNRLAIVGVIGFLSMFIFSFFGGWLMPYGEKEVFTHYVEMEKDYAGVTVNEEYRYTQAEGKSFDSIAKAQFVLAMNSGSDVFTAQNTTYTIDAISDEAWTITRMENVASLMMLGGQSSVALEAAAEVDAGFERAFIEAADSGADTFESGDVAYTVLRDKKTVYAATPMPIALASYNIFDYAGADVTASFDFQVAAEKKLGELKAGGRENASGNFEVDGVNYKLEKTGDEVIISQSGEEYAGISRYIVQAIYPDVFLTLDFKNAVWECIEANGTHFTFPDENGEDQEFVISRKDVQWTIRTQMSTLVTKEYEAPTKEHLLGTDGKGMDILTRLMYGGRISLMIGFLVVVIETLIGVVLGGIAGYFGGWVDNLLMRIVDIFNCIPSLPLVIIIGAVMDQMQVPPQTRIIYLMLILGILGWPGIARLVRGQILSLREQEFMMAAEATGISVNRRIFRHLIPNVIPQLIVICTMSLGSVILMESTLSFLGIGVKFPFASWGNIINAVSNVHVMTNYWFVWIPAGLCILITVLSFNFVGDGLRDAFDPKMKR